MICGRAPPLPMSTPIPPVNELPDSLLIERFQAGDLGVFALLYLRHHARIHGVVLAVVRNPEDALDITQEVFLKAYQRLNTFKHASQFYSWLYRIAVNQCIDFMRRQSARRISSHAPFSEEAFPCKSAHPSAVLERAEFRRQLDAALPALTPCQRRVFILRHKEDLPLKAIASRLGRSTGTVKAHLFQAHRVLRHQLLPYFQFAL